MFLIQLPGNWVVSIFTWAWTLAGYPCFLRKYFFPLNSSVCMRTSVISPQYQGSKQIPLLGFHMIFCSHLAKYSNLILIWTLYRSHLYTVIVFPQTSFSISELSLESIFQLAVLWIIWPCFHIWHLLTVILLNALPEFLPPPSTSQESFWPSNSKVI